MTDQTDAVEPVEEDEVPTEREYIEYLGEEPHGTDFLTSHTIPKGDPVWKRFGLKPTKDVTWERDPFGPGIGQKGNRMLLSVEDLPDGVAEVLEQGQNYRRVTV